MAITLADLAANSTDKMVQGFVNETITDSYLLSALTFDDCMTANGTSDLIYNYKRVKTPAAAAFRALGAEPAETAPVVEKKSTAVGILSDKWTMDRVAKDAAGDLYELYLEESKNAIIRKFNSTFISGDTTKETNGFDGLAKALKGSSTESTSKTDLTTVTQAAALAYMEELDTMLSGLMRTPDVLLMSPAQRVKLNACLRVVGLGTQTMETAGRVIPSYGGIAIQELRVNNWHGRTLVDLNLIQSFGVMVMGIRPAGERAFQFVPPALTVLHKGDTLVVAGRADAVRKLEP